MMKELITRRFAPGREPPPDILIVDGGPGQLGVTLEALTERSVVAPFVVGIAKERGRGDEAKPDRLHLPGRRSPLILPERSPALHILQAIRDEAHRFAVTYHRKLRKAKTLRSGLEEIPGVGPKRRAILLKRFGSLKALRDVTEEALSSVPGIPSGVAKAVKDYLEVEMDPPRGNTKSKGSNPPGET
jgi:excinuclease ABC subunit C